MAQQFIVGIPEENRELLNALGRLAVAHGNLEWVQIMCLKTLKGLRPHEALEQLRGKSSAKIREKIGKAVRAQAKPEHKLEVDRISELLDDARCHSNRRNDLLHRYWAKDQNGAWRTSGDESNWEDLPKVEVVDDLTVAIMKTMVRINAERKEGGFLNRISVKAPNKDSL